MGFAKNRLGMLSQPIFLRSVLIWNIITEKLIFVFFCIKNKSK